MKNKIGDLRNHLFAAIEGLLDEENPLEVERALAVAEVAKQIIDSARVEVNAAKHLNQQLGTDFMMGANGERLINGANSVNGAKAINGANSIRSYDKWE